MARMHFMAHGVQLGYGSFQEHAAMVWFNRTRAKERLEFLAPLVGPGSEQASKLLKDYNNLMFPDSRARDIEMIAKQKKVLDRLKTIKLYARAQ